MEECWVAVWEEGQKSIRAEALVRRRGKHLQGGERDWTEGESSVLWGGRSDQDSRVREQRLDLMGKVKWVVGWRGSPSRASAAPSSRSPPSPPLLPQAGMRRPALKMGCDLTCWYRWPRPSAALAASLGATTSWPAGSCPTTCAESSLCACLGTLAPTAWRHCDRNPHCTHVAWTLANKQMSHHLLASPPLCAAGGQTREGTSHRSPSGPRREGGQMHIGTSLYGGQIQGGTSACWGVLRP